MGQQSGACYLRETQAVQGLQQAEKQKVAGAEVAKAAYHEAKRHAKKVVWAAKADAEKTVFADIDPNGTDVYRIAKQMRRDNQDVTGEMPVRNNQGELSLDD